MHGDISKHNNDVTVTYANRDYGWSRLPRPNAGRKKQKNARKSFFLYIFFNYRYFFFIFLLVMPKYWGKLNFSRRNFPEVGKVEDIEERK